MHMCYLLSYIVLVATSFLLYLYYNLIIFLSLFFFSNLIQSSCILLLFLLFCSVGIAVADVNLDYLQQVRERMPTKLHQRPEVYSQPCVTIDCSSSQNEVTNQVLEHK